jgi:pyruvate,water dikinase
MTEAETFTLPRPELAASSWLRDAVHCPGPLPATVADVVTEWFSLVMGRPVVVVNGYLYMGMGPGSASASFEQAPQSDPADAWYDFYVPRVEAVTRWIERRDWDALSLAEIVDALPDVFAAVASAFASTMAPLMALGGQLGQLIAFCDRYLGDGEPQAAMLLRGHENATSAIGDGLARLAEQARAEPATAADIRAGRLPGVGPWRREFDRLLEEYGRGNETWFEFFRPTWREDPAVPLRLVARSLEGTAGLPRQGGDHVRAALDALPGDAERAQLAALLEANRRYVAVIEDRARFQLILAAAPRAPFLAAGRALVAQGRLDDAGDVFYTGLAPLRDAAAGRDVSLRELAASNRSAVDRWAAISPPEVLGAPLPPGMERIPVLRQQFGLGTAPHEEGLLHGHAAGGGVVSGVARVVHGLDETDRLGPGEILVCRNTAPPWTPLFAIAAAVVTEAGGPLSHTAIAAREYEIPAVVGAREATRLIPDGATITVDGDAGTVRL